MDILDLYEECPSCHDLHEDAEKMYLIDGDAEDPIPPCEWCHTPRCDSCLDLEDLCVNCQGDLDNDRALPSQWEDQDPSMYGPPKAPSIFMDMELIERYIDLATQVMDILQGWFFKVYHRLQHQLPNENILLADICFALKPASAIVRDNGIHQ